MNIKKTLENSTDIARLYLGVALVIPSIIVGSAKVTVDNVNQSITNKIFG